MLHGTSKKMLSEKSQSVRSTYGMIPLLGTGKSLETESGSVVAQGWRGRNGSDS